MKRDMDIVRVVLRAAEVSKPLVEEDYPIEAVTYHVRIMEQAGLIHATFSAGSKIVGTRPSYSLIDLTWEGHELLSAMSDDRLWAKAKKLVLKEGKSWTIEVLKAWLSAQVKETLGLPVT